MLNTLVKPNDVIERKPRNILVFHHSHENVSKITLKLQSCMIICFFVRQLVVLKIFQFLIKAKEFQTGDSAKCFDQIIKANFEQEHLPVTVTFVLILQ